MKRYVKSATNSTMAWFNSDYVNDLMKEMTAKEKRLIGRFANVEDMASYFDGVADAIELLGGKVSKAFDKFMNELAERV